MTGNKTIDTILAGLLALVAAGTLGLFIYTEMVFKKPLPSDSIEKEKLLTETKSKAIIENYKLEKLIINIKSRQSRLRYLEVECYLVPFKSEQIDYFEKNKAIIQDTIIDIASMMEPEELNSLSGKILLVDRIKTRLNEGKKKPALKDILFTRFVVQ